MSGALPHCKDDLHVEVRVERGKNTEHLYASRLDTFTCKNTSYTGPGVVLSFKVNKPEDGMHLLPILIAKLPGWLWDAAGKCTTGMVVSIYHKDNRQWQHFASMTASDAVRLASDITTAGA